MLVILKFDSNTEEYYSSLCENLNIEYKISLKEKDISKASHIILPDADLLLKLIKKMQLMNLYSMLRILKIPILGVNNGMMLMCDKIIDLNKSGLGFFNIDVNSIVKNTNSKFVKREVAILKKSMLLNRLTDKNVLIENSNYLSKNLYTTSIINGSNEEISFTMENMNYYGVQIDVKMNSGLFAQIVNNFIGLKYY